MTLLRADTADRLLRVVATAQRGYQPSLVAAVVRDGDLVWHAARGAATGGPPPGPNVQYRIGSITKTVTALTLLQCRDDGRVDLADPLGSVLGDDVPFAGASLRQLLSHTGGLPAEPAGEWWERRDGEDFAGLRALIRDQPAVLPGSRQQHYSNLGYALLGQAVARLRDDTWEAVARERVLEPLGMRRTTYLPQPPHASGYSVHPWARTLDAEPHTDTGAMSPAGQLWSTVEDLARYAAFWIDPDPDVLHPDTVAEMRIPVGGRPEGLEVSYGLGLSLTAHAGRVRFGHGGSMPGFLAGFAVDPAERTGAVALANATTGSTPEVPSALLSELAAAEPRLPPPWHPEQPLAAAEDLLGPWFWGNTELTLVVEGGQLLLDADSPGRRSRFVAAGVDRWRGLDAYFAAEPLTVVRAPDGSVDHLELASYRLTRTPYPR